MKKIHNKVAELRDETLTNLANFSADMTDNQKAKCIRQMKRQERKVRAYNFLRYQRQKDSKSGGINRLEVLSFWPIMSEYDESIDYNLIDPKSLDPKDKSLWKEVNCPKEIEFYLRLCNQRQFGQARETAFCSSLMSRKFNWSATTETAGLVLKGTYEDEELTDIQRMFLDNMKRVASEEISSSKYLSAENSMKKMKSWKEKTSTSPSGRHLGHYKALVSIIDRSLEKDKITDLKSIQTDIIKCYVGLINYCVRHCYCLKRWKTIVNMMIYKVPGNVEIHRLRVIHLYKAVNDKTLNSGQFGGLPG